MVKRADVMLHLTLLGVALVYGAVRIWPALFPEQGEIVEKSVAVTGVAALAEWRRPEPSGAQESLGIWGRASQTAGPAAELGDVGRQWQVALEQEGWVLSRREESGVQHRWLFSGVVRQHEQALAVFYDLQADERWRLLPVDTFFDSLLITVVTHQKIQLREPSGREWVLGLFHLKEEKPLL